LVRQSIKEKTNRKKNYKCRSFGGQRWKLLKDKQTEDRKTQPNINHLLPELLLLIFS
jgi:hypothetical protein